MDLMLGKDCIDGSRMWVELKLVPNSVRVNRWLAISPFNSGVCLVPFPWPRKNQRFCGWLLKRRCLLLKLARLSIWLWALLQIWKWAWQIIRFGKCVNVRLWERFEANLDRLVWNERGRILEKIINAKHCRRLKAPLVSWRVWHFTAVSIIDALGCGESN